MEMEQGAVRLRENYIMTHKAAIELPAQADAMAGTALQPLRIEAYTDASFLMPWQPGYREEGVQGTWAFVLLRPSNGKRLEKSGRLGNLNGTKSTINRCELYAIVRALETIATNVAVDTGRVEITVYSDSQCAISWFQSEKKLQTNMPQALVLKKRLVDRGFEMTLMKMKGHSGNQWNNRADSLANGLLATTYPEAIKVNSQRTPSFSEYTDKPRACDKCETPIIFGKHSETGNWWPLEESRSHHSCGR